MERKTRQWIAILVLLLVKFCSPCPEECFVQHEWKFVQRKTCECPTQRDPGSQTCISSGDMVAANRVCGADDHGLTCLNDVPTGFDQTVTGIMLNCLFNLTTLTKQHIPPLPNLITFGITGSTIQAIEAGTFSSTPSMMWVTIRCSRLLHIGDLTFYSLPSLKTISLKHNLIQTVSPRAFIGLNSLEKIVLGSNQLTAIPFEAVCLARRSTTVARLQVNLEDNQIRTVLETGWEQISGTAVSLLLRGNPLVCDGRVRWLVCNATTLQSFRRGRGNIVRAGSLHCTSPTELTSYDFKSLHTNPYCSSAELISTPTKTHASTSPMAEPTRLPAKSSGTTASALTQLATKTASSTVDRTRSFALKKNHDDDRQASMDYLYLPLGLTAAVIVLLGGTAAVVIMYKRCVSRGRQNPVHRMQGVIISSQLISNRLYQRSGSATGNARDTGETEETDEDSGGQNSAQNLHGVIINTSQLISNRLYQHSGSATGNARDTEETEEIDEDSGRQNPAHRLHGITINTSQLISNRLYQSSGTAINNASADTGRTEETDQNSDDDMEPYSITPLDQIDDH
uniref:LRRCT domain-containing protein n=2 Tax=Branchiostoma floridae TaxID=7739 RepID=C3YVP5_BRAFL|eukprot:XP_002599567.1 hypothetical protein BRAFLDRAFT_77669 [Branchiostoma floridae]